MKTGFILLMCFFCPEWNSSLYVHSHSLNLQYRECTGGGVSGSHSCWQRSIGISLCSHGIHGLYLPVGTRSVCQSCPGNSMCHRVRGNMTQWPREFSSPKGIQNDTIRWFFVLLGQSFVLVQFYYIEIGYIELLGQFSNFIESHWFSIHIHVSVHVELLQYTLLRITDLCILFSFCGMAVRMRFFFSPEQHLVCLIIKIGNILPGTRLACIACVVCLSLYLVGHIAHCILGHITYHNRDLFYSIWSCLVAHIVHTLFDRVICGIRSSIH